MNHSPPPFPPKSWMAGRMPAGDTRVQGSSGELEPGNLSFPGYVVERLLGAGGMGAVYQVRQLDTGAVRALKTLKMDAASLEARQRFQVEIESLGAMNHPNVVRVHAADLKARRPFVVMELVEGVELADAINEPWEEERAAAFIEKVLRALAFVHERGIIHRDLKPQNIFLCDGDEPKLADFGLARIREGAGLTQTGDLLGTPAYMAPEQILGLTGTVGPAADIWAIGVILFRMVTGRLPFTGTGAMGMMSEVATGRAPLMSSVSDSIDRDLDAIVDRALAHDANKRYPSAEAMADDLAQFLEGETPEALLRGRRFARRGILIGSVAIVLVFIASALWFADSARRSRLVELRVRGQSALQSADLRLNEAELLSGDDAGGRAVLLLGDEADWAKRSALLEGILAREKGSGNPKLEAVIASLELRREMRAALEAGEPWRDEDASVERAYFAKVALARACRSADAEKRARSLALAVSYLSPWLRSGEPGALEARGLGFMAAPARNPGAARRFLSLFGGTLERPGCFDEVFAQLSPAAAEGLSAFVDRCYREFEPGPEDLPWIMSNYSRLRSRGNLARRSEFLADTLSAAALELLEEAPLSWEHLSRELERSFNPKKSIPLLKGPHPWLSPKPRAALLAALEKLERFLSQGGPWFTPRQRMAIARRLSESMAFGALHGALWYQPELFDRLVEAIDSIGFEGLFAPASWFRLSAGAPNPLPPGADLEEEVAAFKERTSKILEARRAEKRRKLFDKSLTRKKESEERRKPLDRRFLRVVVLWNRRAAALLGGLMARSREAEARSLVRWWREMCEPEETRPEVAPDIDRVYLVKDSSNAHLEASWLSLRWAKLSAAERAAELRALSEVRTELKGMPVLIEARALKKGTAVADGAFLDRCQAVVRQFLDASFYTELLAEWLELRALQAELTLESGDNPRARGIASELHRSLAGMKAPRAEALRERLESSFPHLREGRQGHDDGR